MLACETLIRSRPDRALKPSGSNKDLNGFGGDGSSGIGIFRARLHVPHGGAMKMATIL